MELLCNKPQKTCDTHTHASYLWSARLLRGNSKTNVYDLFLPGPTLARYSFLHSVANESVDHTVDVVM